MTKSGGGEAEPVAMRHKPDNYVIMDLHQSTVGDLNTPTIVTFKSRRQHFITFALKYVSKRSVYRLFYGIITNTDLVLKTWEVNRGFRASM